MPSDKQHNPPEPPPSRIRQLRAHLASERPYEQQDALREVLAFAARTKLIAFSTAARIEEIGWPAPDDDLRAAVRLAIADLVVCLVWEAVWPPDDEPDEMAEMNESSEATGDGESSASPSPPLTGGRGTLRPEGTLPGRGARLVPAGSFARTVARRTGVFSRACASLCEEEREEGDRYTKDDRSDKEEP